MIHLLANDIATVVGGKLLGDGTLAISGAAGLNEASDADLSFFHNVKYIESLQKTKARVIIVPDVSTDLPLPEGKTWIKVTNPQMAYGLVLAMIDKQQKKHPEGIHPKAHVEPTATVGKGTIIYPGCYIGHNVKVGENCLLYPNVVLREDTIIGNRVIIHPGTVLGSDGYGFATDKGVHHKIPQIGKVVVEDDVEIGANCAVDRATTGETRIGAGSKLDNLIHIAHNVQIGRGCLITGQVGIAGSAKIGNYVMMGGQVGIAGHLTVGDGAVIAAQSGVMSDVDPGAVLFGSPVRPIKQAMKLQAIYGKLEDIYDTIKQVRKKLL